MKNFSEETSSAFIAPFHANFDCRIPRQRINFVQYSYRTDINSDEFSYISRETVFSKFKPSWVVEAKWVGVVAYLDLSLFAYSNFSCHIVCNQQNTYCFVIMRYMKISKGAFKSMSHVPIFIKGKRPGNSLPSTSQLTPKQQHLHRFCQPSLRNFLKFCQILQISKNFDLLQKQFET